MRNDQSCSKCGHDNQGAHPKDIAIGVLLGSVIGATTALLLAPKSGAELRQDITDKFEEISDSTQDLASSVQEGGQRIAKNATSQANHWIEHAYNIVDELSNGISSFRDKTKVEKNQFRDTIESASDKLGDVLDWASLGIRLLQSAKKRR